MPECVICQAPFPGAVPDSGECLTCRKEAEAAAEALRARLEASDADWRAPGGKADGFPAEDGYEDDGVDEETVRLRAMYARQYGSPEQRAAYCSEAPF